MTRFQVLAIAGLSLSISLSVEAQAFSDQTFNLADYTITKSLQIGTATVSQTLTGGNPDAAILADFVIPTNSSLSNELGSIFYLNKNFTYDPISGGTLSSVTLSLDKKYVIVTPPSSGVGNGQTFVIFQGGNYYVDAVALGSAQNVYHTGTLTAAAGDFSLITNMSSGAIDSTVHPNFAAGVLEFGFRNGFVFDPGTAAEVKIFEDNFNVTLTPAVAAVPEPETYAMLLVGLGLLSRRISKRCVRRQRSTNLPFEGTCLR